MKKVIYAAVIAFMFLGCAEYSIGKQKYLDAKQEYINAKAVYQDDKHLLFELNSTIGQEVNFWRNERDTIKGEFR